MPLAHRQACDRRRCVARQPNRSDCRGHTLMLSRRDRCKGSRARPGAEDHSLLDGQREAAVDLRKLRQVGELARCQSSTVDAAVAHRYKTHQRLQQRTLAGAVGTRERGHRARQKLAGDMMDRRDAPIGHDDVGQRDVGGALHSERPHHGEPQHGQHTSRHRQALRCGPCQKTQFSLHFLITGGQLPPYLRAISPIADPNSSFGILAPGLIRSILPRFPGIKGKFNA